jgi:hypothetical protein
VRRYAAVLCDLCGQPFAALGEAVVAQQLDELGRVVALNLDHRRCAEARRDQIAESEQTIADYPAADLLRHERADALRATARAHWASATRIRKKVERLRVSTLTADRVDSSAPVTAQDVRQRPVFRGSR